jgi:hypothetical protein
LEETTFEELLNIFEGIWVISITNKYIQMG